MRKEMILVIGLLTIVLLLVGCTSSLRCETNEEIIDEFGIMIGTVCYDDKAKTMTVYLKVTSSNPLAGIIAMGCGGEGSVSDEGYTIKSMSIELNGKELCE